MSTWTSKAAAALLATGLLACVPVAPAGTAAGGNTGPMTVAGGDVTVAPPQGYCIDRSASQDDGESAVVVIGRCRDGSPAKAALIAVSIGQPGSSGVLQSGAKALSDYFLTSAGRAALARDGRASSVTVDKTAVADGALILHLSDRQTGPQWRAFLGLKGRLVSISVSAPDGGTGLDQTEGRRLLDRSVVQLRRANPT